MREMVLLGAGASVKAGVPGSYDMTQEIARRFADYGGLQEESRLLKFVIGGLLFQKGVRGDDPFGGVDVEEVFNAVILLAERQSLEVAPFVGSWHAMVEQLDRAPPSSYVFERVGRLLYESATRGVIDAFPSSPPAFAEKNIDNALGNTIKKTVDAMVKNRSASFFSSESVGKAVRAYLEGLTKEWLNRLKSRQPRIDSAFKQEFSQAVQETLRSGAGAIYRAAASEMIQVLADIVWIENADVVRYLKPLLRPLSRQDKYVIATLNYDNCVELMAADSGEVCETGIDCWSAKGQFETSSRGLMLLKLHGSIDWALEEGPTTSSRPMPHSVIRKIEPAEVKQVRHHPAVIFGHRNKLTAEGPFLDLLRSFRQELQAVDRLTVVGYSFRDPHVNEYISQWLNGGENRRLRVVDPNFESSRAGYACDLQQHCASRLEVIPEYAEKALENAFPGDIPPATPNGSGAAGAEGSEREQ